MVFDARSVERQPLLDQLAGWLKRLADDAANQHAAAGGMIAADPDSRAMLELADRVAASRSTVLIGGPSGAGKEVLARYIHANSRRAAAAFVAINCAALPEAMLEAMLFGHERGAYTGAAGSAPGLFRAADGGTLFLDEIGELPLALQAKLLRAVQEREVLPLGAIRPVPVDVRLVAASNRDLFAAAAEGEFREDLLWRLAVFPLTLKPLAQRREDIVPLVAALLRRHADAEGRPIPRITEQALRRLVRHDWPGNVRELDNVLQRAAILAGDGAIELDCIRIDAPPVGGAAQYTAPGLAPADVEGGLTVAVKASEAAAIRTALAEVGGQRALAARRLGISERTLRYKLAALAGRPRTTAARADPTATSRARLQ